MANLKLFLSCIAILLVAQFEAVASTKEILVIGSSKVYDEVKGINEVSGDSLLKTLRSLAPRELKIRGRSKLTFLDIYNSKTLDTAYGGRGNPVSFEYHCHSLTQWFFWPEGRDERIKNLKGQGEVKWDHVILVGDPYIIANMPGYFAEGVKLISEVVHKGSAKVSLYMPWGRTRSKVATRLSEVVARVGLSSEIPVLPLSVSKGIAKKIKGPFEFVNPFLLRRESNRSILYHHTGTSSERGIERALGRVFKRCVIKGRRANPNKEKAPLDFNYGRANSNFEKDKRYKVWPKSFVASYGFPMQDHSKTADETMLYGLDKRNWKGSGHEDGTDIGIAWDMVRDSEVEKNIRTLPIRLLWAKFHDLAPDQKPCRDQWHMSNFLDDATATFLYTLQSGRCPIGEKPQVEEGDEYLSWIAQRVGY